MKNVALIENVIPHYRLDFYNRLSESTEFEFTIFCQDSDKSLNLKLVHDQLRTKPKVLSYLQFRRIVRWQWLPVLTLWRDFDVLVFYANPRYISTVICATLFRFAGKRVVLKNQYQTARSSGIRKRIRLAWWKLFRNFLVYTDTEAQAMFDDGFRNRNVVGWNNGLDQNAIETEAATWDHHRLRGWRQSESLENRLLVISVARAERKNNFEMAIEGIQRLRERYGSILWCLIGDGPHLNHLRSLAATMGLTGHVRFAGAIYDEHQLAPWFLNSRMLLHPGAIGLTICHAFGYGLPVVTHDNAINHMPEFGAMRNGENGLTFRENNLDSMVETVGSLLVNDSLRERLSAGSINTVRNVFNTRIMAERMHKVIRRALNDHNEMDPKNWTAY